MSTLRRDPMRPDGGRVAAPVPGGRWPSDAGLRPRLAPIGAEWDPLAQTWPALHPEPAPPAPRSPAGPGATRASGADGPGAVPGAMPAGGRALVRDGRTIAPVPASAFATVPPEPRPARDVSPSRLAYRLNRLWLTPSIRRLVCQGVPALVLVAGLAVFWAGEERRAMMLTFVADLRAAVENRPEFRIDTIEVLTDTPEVAQAVLARMDLTLPESSLRLDLRALRTRAESLDAVARAAVQVRAGGVLELRLTERRPAMVWRHAGGLALIDDEGRRVAMIATRALRADLPLIAGEGAPDAVAEAVRLIEVAAPIRDRLLGLTRIGERRWDLVLDGGPRILLPAAGPVAALERVLALDAAQGLLARDILAVDMRNPLRPTLRLSPEAATELSRLRQLDTRMATR